LRFDESPGIEAGDLQKGNFLIVAALLPGILSVADDDGPRSRVDIVPLDATDLFLPHGRCNSKANDAANGNELPVIALDVADNRIEFVPGWPALPFVAAPYPGPTA
jgi:hypothetical protein